MFPRRPARAPGGTGDMISLSAGLSLWLPLYVWIHLCVFTGRLGEEVRVYHFLVVVIGSQCVNPCLFEQLEYLSCSWTCNIFLKYEWGCFVCFPCTNFYTSSLCVPQASCGGAWGNRSQVITLCRVSQSIICDFSSRSKHHFTCSCMCGVFICLLS